MGIKLLAAIFLGLLFFAGATSCTLPTFLAPTEPRCLPPPASFTEDVLIGIWRAGNPKHYDELTIAEDGTYRQHVHVEYPNAGPLDYQGEPHRWHLEYSDTGIPYLHLEDLRFCGMNPEIPCQVTDGSGYDFCRDESVKMRGEGILIVLGTNTTSSPPEDQVYYYLHYPLGSENSWAYARHDK